MKRFAVAALGLVAFAAHAEEHEADGGLWRLGAAAAFANYDRDDGSLDDSVAGFKLSAQYQFNNWWGIEGAYLSTGDFETSQATVGPGSGPSTKQSYSGFSIAGVVHLPWDNEDIDLYAKVGFFDLDANLAQSDVIISSGREDGLLIGGGAAITITDQFGIRAELDWYDVDIAELWSVNLGVEYRF